MKNAMRLFFVKCFWCLCLWPSAQVAWCQETGLVQQENELSNFQGAAFVTKAINLSQALYAEKLFRRSLKVAEEAYEKAEELSWEAAMSDALYWQAKALENLPSKRSTNKTRALRLYDEAYRLAELDTFRLRALKSQKELALKLPNTVDPQSIQQRIDKLIGAAETKRPSTGLFSRRRKVLENEKNLLEKEVGQLSEEQQQLRQQLETKDQQLENMTAAQIRQELLLSEQTRLLDSLAFSKLLDSLELANKSMELREREVELQKRGAELALRKSQLRFYLAGGIGVLVLAIGLFFRYQATRRYNTALKEKNEIIAKERERSDSLLLNILPAAVAEELKANGTASARYFAEATVMFLDFENFTAIARKLTPEQLVECLHEAFTAFDDIVTRRGLEKIKTIGDAYMCAAGLGPSATEATVQMVGAALEIQAYLKQRSSLRNDEAQPAFRARIGIHTGPVVAGVVGTRKFAYDIWGDTVNIAARLETAGKADLVNISATTFTRVRDTFPCTHRGPIAIKHAGEVEMYFVEG